MCVFVYFGSNSVKFECISSGFEMVRTEKLTPSVVLVIKVHNMDETIFESINMSTSFYRSLYGNTIYIPTSLF